MLSSRFSARLDATADRLRGRMGELADFDLVTQDLLIGIAKGIEKHAWMLRVQGR